LQITRLRVAGFKSFPDPTELLIEAGLTGIVGPNGCGKSNIVEALRWVMGESSARGLRGGEMEDVIFNGAAGRAPFDMAEVGLELAGRIEGLTGFEDHDELEISRRLGRGTGSLYKINGREARARDIQLLFADAGAGSRSAAVISQGQIGFIVDAKPQERRRLLEDGAGIGGLHGRRREAELRLMSTEQNLARIVDLLQEQEKRLAELARQNRQAERYRKIAADLRAGEALLLLARWADAVRAGHSSGAALAEARARRDRSQMALADLRRQSQERTSATDRLRQAAADLATLEAALAERHAAQRSEQGRRAAHLRELQDRATEARDDCARDLAARQEILERQARMEAEAAESAERIAALAPEAAAIASSLEEEAGVLDAAEARFRQTTAEAAKAEASLATVGARRDGRVARLAEIEGSLARLSTVVPVAGSPAGAGDATSELERIADELGAAEAALDGLRSERESVAQTLIEVARQQAEARERLLAVEQQWREHRAAAALFAERERATQREGERLGAREAAHAERRAAHDAKARAVDLESARIAAQDAASAAEAARASAEAARAEETRATAAQREAEAAHAALRAELGATQAERQLLQELLPAPSAGSLIDRLRVADGYADALAAALGDDLLAGTLADEPVFWRSVADGTAGASADPGLAEGVEPLSARVAAPPELARRLAQIGVVEPDQAAALQPALAAGQRLVSRSGGLWRWDGLIRRPDTASAAAARLRQRRRHEELTTAELSLRQQHDEAAVSADMARTAAESARRTAHAKAEELAMADRAAVAAERERERALHVTEALAREAAELAAEAMSLATDRAELAEEQRRLAGDRPDEAGFAVLERLLAEARQAAVDQERRARELTAARATADRASAEAERRAQALRAEAARLRQRQDTARAAAAAAALAHATRAAEHRARLDALEAERAPLVAAIATDRSEHAAASTRAIASAGARAAAEAALQAQRTRQRDLAARHATLQAELRRTADRQQALAAESLATAARVEQLDRRLMELDERALRLAGDVEAAAAALAEVEAGLPALADRLAELGQERHEAARGLAEAETALATVLADLRAAEEATVAAREAAVLAEAVHGQAREQAEAAAAIVAERLQRPAETLLADTGTRAAVEAADLAELEARVARLRTARERIGPVNLRADAELAELRLAADQSRAEEAELRTAVERLKRAIGTINREGRERLLQAFEQVDVHFRRLFARLFGGGRAHLRLTDLDDPLNAGLELEASPPGKRLTSIGLLSGGEKTLTALALVFAFFLTQPAPLCVLDEVDAPLDDANVERFVAMMDEISAATGTRFLVVTHHPLTMARMHRLYGVTMLERGVSRLVSVALEEAVELRATA
jgi:chromosome segregation protein